MRHKNSASVTLLSNAFCISSSIQPDINGRYEYYSWDYRDNGAVFYMKRPVNHCSGGLCADILEIEYYLYPHYDHSEINGYYVISSQIENNPYSDTDLLQSYWHSCSSAAPSTILSPYDCYQGTLWQSTPRNVDETVSISSCGGKLTLIKYCLLHFLFLNMFI